MERMVEIVSHIVRHYLSKQCNGINNEQEIIDELFRLGYTREEVETAFGLMCLIPRHLDGKNNYPDNLGEITNGYRIFSPAEKRILSVACQGVLISLINSSLLTWNELEKILAEAIQLDANEIGLKELESILHKVITDEERLLMILHYSSENRPCFFLN